MLVTGFGSFAGVEDNPSARLAAACGEPFLVLEVAWEAVGEFLASDEAREADALLMIGVAARRTWITPELFGRNTVGEAPDVRGVARPGDAEPGGEILRAATFWTPEDFLDPLVRPSMNAGTYLCNYALYRALGAYPNKPVGFLHVPPFSAVGEEDQRRALAGIIGRRRPAPGSS